MYFIWTILQSSIKVASFYMIHSTNFKHRRFQTKHEDYSPAFRVQYTLDLQNIWKLAPWNHKNLKNCIFYSTEDHSPAFRAQYTLDLQNI